MQGHRKSGAKIKRDAFTLVELLVVVAIIGILAGLLLPVLARAKMKAQQIQCVANLKQVGTAFQIFAHDHNSLFPMEVSTNDGGTLEFVLSSYLISGQFYFQYRHFQALSNELAVPKLLVCPSDHDRIVASNFQNFDNVNISYFVGANADYSLPNSMLAGDRNITNGVWGGQTIVRLGDGTAVYWTGDMHQFRGNILFADSHVDELTTAGLVLASYGAPSVMDLVTPILKSSSPPSSAPPLTPPPNLPAPPSPPASSRPAGAGTASSTGGYAPPGSMSSGSTTARSSSRAGSSTQMTGGTDSGRSTSNNLARTKAVQTNAVPATNAPPAVLAETPADLIHRNGHLAWWFWLWLLLMLLAVEGTRRYYLRLRQEQKNRSPWSRSHLGR